MTIAIDARIVYTSTGRYVERLLHHLQELDHENEYVVMLLQKDFERWQPSAPNFRKVVADYPPYTLREQLQFAWQLYGLKADLVHFTAPHQPVLYFNPHVTTIHDLTLIDFVNKRKQGLLKDFYKNQLKPWVFRLAMWVFSHLSRHIITPTDFVKQDLCKRFRVQPDNVTFTYEAAEITVGGVSPYAPLQGKKYILYVGNAYPYKNLEQLTRAYRLLNRPDYALVLVGKTDFFYEQLQQQVAQEGAENIIFTGFVSDEELAWLYKNAAVYVFPSLSEGFGLPGLEAMLHGLPVASSNATSLPEVYGEAACYFDPRSSEDMAAKIAEVLDNNSLRNTLVTAGKERLRQFSWRKMAEETLGVYKASSKN